MHALKLCIVEACAWSFGLSATSSTFLSEQISHQQPVNITFLSEQISNNHQQRAKRTDTAGADLAHKLSLGLLFTRPSCIL
jgi:hypothetical protein